MIHTKIHAVQCLTKIVLDVIKVFSLKFCLVLAIIKSKISERHHLSDYDGRRGGGQLEAGQSVTTVDTAMGVSKSVISLLNKASEGGNALQKHAWNRGRNTISLENRYVLLVAKVTEIALLARQLQNLQPLSVNLFQQEPSYDD
ncbi:hypothetical protein TNCV_2718311 [Trichonephila clavipes]|nr:hypothetical protein TNCV_2718311 [Trichonephila clavipes]